MELRESRVVVTGGARGIGRALCRRFAAEGAAAVVVSDLDEEGARSTAAEIGGVAVRTDVSDPADVAALVARSQREMGGIDLFCSNAGVRFGVGIHASDDLWDRTWRINTLAHLFAARAVLPEMVERGSGHLLQTVSAAGLLTELGDAAYSVTKHAALALAEWLAVTYGDRGIGVSCLCPEGVRTDMLSGAGDALLLPGAIEPEDVAEAAVTGLREGRFLILPHPRVAEYERRRADDRERWLGGMRRLRRSIPDQDWLPG